MRDSASARLPLATGRDLLQRHLDALRAADLAGRERDRPRLLANLVAMAARVTDSDYVSIYLLDAGGRTMSREATHGYDGYLLQKYARIPADGITGATAHALAPRAVSTKDWPEATRADLVAEGFVENALLPLHAEGRLIGSLNLARTRPMRYTADDLLTGEIFAYEVTRHIETARLRSEADRRAADLTLIHELGQMIAGELDLRNVLDTGARHLARIADVPQTFILLFDDATQDLYVVASNVDGHGLSNVRLKKDDDSLPMQAFLERRPLLVQDVEAPPAGVVFSRERVAEFGQHALMAIPLVARGVAIGAALLGETRPDHPLDNATLERAVVMGNQLATAMANAKLVEDLRRSYRELEQAQHSSIQRERLAALGELAASVAHEVRNPLAVIFNSLGALERLLPPVEDARVLHGIATEEAGRLNNIIGELLDFARPSEPQLKLHAVAPVLSGAVEAAANAHGIPVTRITSRVPDDIGTCSIDAQLVRQAVINLLVNALQAARSEGLVEISAVRVTEGGRGYLDVVVTNGGAPIPAEIASQIFQPFFTTKATGAGLGLAIVKRIAEAHHGAVSYSAEDGTTRFRLRLCDDLA